MKRILITLTTLAAMSMVTSCKKADTPATKTTPEAHQQEMVQKSFMESKKAVAVKVNGEEITMFALFREMNAMAPDYVKAGQQRTPDIDAKVRNDAINILVFQELAVQEAKKRGMKVKPEAVTQEFMKMKKDAGSEKSFQDYLDRNGLTAEELVKVLENDITFELIAAHEVDAKVMVDDALLKDYYARNKSAFMTKDPSPRQMKFEEAKGEVEKRVRAAAAEKRMKEWEKELRKNARIKISEQK